MPRYISFMLTQDQIRARTKTVTRRLGWKQLKPGTLLMGAEKCQGLGKGSKIKSLGLIRVTDVRRERLGLILRNHAYGSQECILEGFPPPHDLSWPSEFVAFFIRSHRGCTEVSQVTRIEFEYVDAGPEAA